MTNFLLDTNVISELVRLQPDRGVSNWIETVDEGALYLSVLTVGEIQKGIAVLVSGKRKTQLESWLQGELLLRFRGRMLSIDEQIASSWGLISGQAQLQGTPLPVIDGLLAATCLQHQLTLATRNVRDFTNTGIATIDPWQHNKR